MRNIIWAPVVIGKEIIPEALDKIQATAALLLYYKLLFKIVVRYSFYLLTL